MSGIFDWLMPKKKAPVSPPPQVTVDLYAVLGVPSNASHEDIKQAFRELAMKFHPDRNPDDPVAEKKYTEISTAYAVLGDETQRAAYDRLRPPKETPRPRGAGGGLIPRGTRASQEPAVAPEQPKPISKAIDKSIIDQMFGPVKKAKGEVKEVTFDFLAPGQPNQPPARIPVPTSPFASFDPASRRVPMMPSVDVPDDSQLWQIVQHWPLEWAWEMAREARQTMEFRNAGAIGLDAIAGGGVERTAEADIAEIFGISEAQMNDVLRTKGREVYYVNVIYPIFDRVIEILDKLKPPDLPGRFFLDWDPSGKVIELIYAENIGRRR
jgi:curved DNA-binding protein CbpA